MKLDFDNIYTYHTPEEGQPERYQALRARAKELAMLIDELCPDSRERSIAFTQLETAIFWANAAIARNEKGGGGDGSTNRD
jgi:hypothetical protein